MSSDLIVKTTDGLEADRCEAGRQLRLVQSADGVEMPDVGLCQFNCEEGGVITTFACAYFDYHLFLLVWAWLSMENQ